MKYLQKDVDISNLSNFKTKAISKYYFEVHNRQDIDKLINIINFSKKEKLQLLFLSGGTNVLFAFEIYEGIVIKNCLQGWTYDKNKKILKSYSGELISDIAIKLEQTFSQKLWHRFIGLPGSVGGAVFGNAGCFGLEIENNFSKVDLLNIDTLDIESFTKKEMDFSYRNSIIKQTGKYFIISTYFDLSKKIEKYHSDVDNIDFRENKQPKGNTCGSFFKNPNRDNSAGSLIEKSGLKGYKIGGAYFSELHANFLMSDGTASYKDLLNLIKLAQKEVLNNFGFKIKPEVRIIFNK